MRCPICTLPIEESQPIVELPELAGGGRAHAGCWEQTKPFVDRLLAENGVKDYGVVGEIKHGEAA